MLLLFTSLLSFLGAFLLFFFNKKQFAGNIYLASMLFINALFTLVNYCIHYSGSLFLGALFFGHFSSLFYLSGPLLYFYVRSILTNNATLRKWDWLHFIPFFIVTIGISPYFFRPFDEKLLLVSYLLEDNDLLTQQLHWWIPLKLNLGARPILKFGYHIFCYYVFFSKIGEFKKILHLNITHFRHVRNWLMILITTSFLITAIMIILGIRSIQFVNSLDLINQEYIIINIITIIFLIMNLCLFAYPEILYGMSFSVEMSHPQPGKNEYAVLHLDVVDKDHTNHIEQQSGIKTSNYTFIDEYLAIIEQSIDEQIKRKLFLDEDFNLDMLSSTTSIPKHRLSMYFNSIIKQSFSEWKNKLRVEYAITLFSSEQSKSFTIQALSSKCGFANQTSFIKAFKTVTGQTPSEYNKN